MMMKCSYKSSAHNQEIFTQQNFEKNSHIISFRSGVLGIISIGIHPYAHCLAVWSIESYSDLAGCWEIAWMACSFFSIHNLY
jgi:hypothetical protein